MKVLRDHAAEGSPRVTSMELFYDLVYVFAVTQLSHRLFDNLTARGAVETLVLFLAVWWSWNYTAWATNWIDPDTKPVRELLVVLMLASLIMSAAIPEAFGPRGLAFVVAYVAGNLIRGGFMVAAFGRRTTMGRNYAQLTAWNAMAGAVFVAGALVHGNARLVLWIAALVVEYAAPVCGFWLPRLGSTPISDWTLAGAHLAERCQLVVIIALGETILAVGATFAGLTWSASIVAAFVAGFVLAVSLWWVYFAGHAEAGVRTIASSADPARLARAGYAYAHAVMVAGVIVVAVAIELTIDDPRGSTDAATACTILLGPALYLAGTSLFRYALGGRIPHHYLVGIAALGALALLTPVASPLVLLWLAALVVFSLSLVH